MPPSFFALLALLLFFSPFCATPLAASLQEPTHQLIGPIDGPLFHTSGILVMLAHGSYFSLSSEGEPQRPSWKWDRPFVGTYNADADRWSKQLAAVGLVVPLLWSAEGQLGRVGQEELIADAVILFQAIAIDASLNLWVRGQPLWSRPLLFSNEAPEAEKNSAQARSSFYSGHASTSFAIATAAVSINASRENSLIPTAPLAALLYGTAGTISALRVAAGKHYPTDVVAGAAVGSLIGWAIPKLHEVPAEGEGRGLRGYLRRKELKIIPYPSGIIVTWRVGGTTPQSEIW